MADDINTPVPQLTLEQEHALTKGILKIKDGLDHVQILVRIGSETHGGEVEQETSIRFAVDDWADVERLYEHLDHILTNRRARLAALPTYRVRFIDDPVFPVQRMQVVRWNNSFGGNDLLFIGTEAEVRKEYDVFGEQPGRDVDGRPQYWARDKT